MQRPKAESVEGAQRLDGGRSIDIRPTTGRSPGTTERAAMQAMEPARRRVAALGLQEMAGRRSSAAEVAEGAPTVVVHAVLCRLATRSPPGREAPL